MQQYAAVAAATLSVNERGLIQDQIKAWSILSTVFAQNLKKDIFQVYAVVCGSMLQYAASAAAFC